MLKLHADPPFDQGPENPQPAAFVSTEKSLDRAESTRSAEAENALEAVSPIDAAFAACRAVGGGDGVFGHAWTDRLHEVVQPGYSLLCLTHDQPAELARLAVLAELRFTAATKKNPALFCIKLAARPKSTDQDKICSDWSALLRCALEENIPPDGFIPWVGTTTIAACKKAVAEQQRTAKLAAGLKPRKPRVADPAAAEDHSVGAEGRPRLELRLFGTDGTAGEMVELPASIHAAVLDAMTSPAPQIERLERLAASLQVLVSELTSDGAAKLPSETSERPTHAVTGEVADV